MQVDLPFSSAVLRQLRSQRIRLRRTQERPSPLHRGSRATLRTLITTCALKIQKRVFEMKKTLDFSNNLLIIVAGSIPALFLSIPSERLGQNQGSADVFLTRSFLANNAKSACCQ